MAYWHINRWMKGWYPEVIWDKPENGRRIYLTFDDGPTPEITEKVMDILDHYSASATFFCLGRNVERHPEIYRKILERGHSVGNHTYSHLMGWKHSDEEYFQDIALARHQINSVLFRPPYGRIRRSQIRQLKDEYKIILWDVMSHDYEQRISRERSLKAVLRYTKEGSIVVFHDSVKAWNKLQYILPGVLEEYSGKGYKFDKLEI
jgi:peptidoglycan/xylan/chitin deacetylase (PgdA/CDA1 family)